jgi:hypothetical protein
MKPSYVPLVPASNHDNKTLFLCLSRTQPHPRTLCTFSTVKTSLPDPVQNLNPVFLVGALCPPVMVNVNMVLRVLVGVVGSLSFILAAGLL